MTADNANATTWHARGDGLAGFVIDSDAGGFHLKRRYDTYRSDSPEAAFVIGFSQPRGHVRRTWEISAGGERWGVRDRGRLAPAAQALSVLAGNIPPHLLLPGRYEIVDDGGCVAATVATRRTLPVRSVGATAVGLSPHVLVAVTLILTCDAIGAVV